MKRSSWKQTTRLLPLLVILGLCVGCEAPVIEHITPRTRTAGGSGFTLDVGGHNFIPETTVLVDGVAKTTTFVSTGYLQAEVLASDIATPHSMVISLSQGGESYGGAILAVLGPPTPTDLEPWGILAGSATAPFLVTVRGENFASSNEVLVNGVFRASTFSLNTFRFMLEPDEVTDPGTVTIEIREPGTQIGGAIPFYVSETPLVAELVPDARPAGSLAFFLEVRGLGLTPEYVVRFQGEERVTVEAPSGLSAEILASDVSVVGSFTVDVYDPREDEVIGALPFTVLATSPEITGLSNSAGPGVDTIPSASLSADGRYVAFGSSATDLVPGDDNGLSDVFLYDSLTGTTELVSLTTAGEQLEGLSHSPSVSADGSLVTFTSNAINLEGTGTLQVYLRDRSSSETTLVSLSTAGDLGDDESSGASISDDGTRIAYSSVATNLVASDINSTEDIFVRDLVTDETYLVSQSSSGLEANFASGGPRISADGRYVAFHSHASNLVLGDGNGLRDVFVHDLQTAQTSRVSVSSSGTESNSLVTLCDISGDGEFVTFFSHAFTLVPETAGNQHLFRHHRPTGVTELVSYAMDGSPATESSHAAFGGSLSSDGRYVLFSSSAPGLTPTPAPSAGSVWDQVYVRDMETGLTALVSSARDGSAANQVTSSRDISADGSTVLFTSQATNLPFVQTAGSKNYLASTGVPYGTPAFLSTTALQPELMPVGSPEFTILVFGAGFSRDCIVQFEGSDLATTHVSSHLLHAIVPADDLMQSGFFSVAVFDPTEGTTSNSQAFIVTGAPAVAGVVERASVSSDEFEGNGNSERPEFSPDGRFVAFQSDAPDLVPGDTNGQCDVFLRDRDTGTTELISLSSTSVQGDDDSRVPDVSADGNRIAFYSQSGNFGAGPIEAVYIRDRAAATTEVVSQNSLGTPISGNCNALAMDDAGNRVVFEYDANGLVPGDNNFLYDIFVRDIAAGTTTRVSVASDGTPANQECADPQISADGRYVAFFSAASNLVIGDTNGTLDIFVHDLDTATTTRVSLASDGAEALGASFEPSLSADGRYVVFRSFASNLSPGDTNGFADIFRHDTQTGVTEMVSVDMGGGPADSYSNSSPTVSADGRFVTFSSYADNLTSDDGPFTDDVFVRDMLSGITHFVTLGIGGVLGSGSDSVPVINADGSQVVFESVSNNLVPNDNNAAADVFVADTGF